MYTSERSGDNGCLFADRISLSAAVSPRAVFCKPVGQLLGFRSKGGGGIVLQRSFNQTWLMWVSVNVNYSA